MSVIYSTVRSELKLSTMRRGFVLGVIGIAIFLYMGIYLTPAELQTYGLVGFFLSGALITLGLKPYRRLVMLESRPHQLRLVDGTLEFSYGLKPFLAVRIDNIRALRYRDVSDSYGIIVEVKDLQAVQALNPRLNLQDYALSTQKRYGGDLFFPFFSARSHEKILADLQ